MEPLDPKVVIVNENMKVNFSPSLLTKILLHSNADSILPTLLKNSVYAWPTLTTAYNSTQIEVVCIVTP